MRAARPLWLVLALAGSAAAAPPSPPAAAARRAAIAHYQSGLARFHAADYAAAEAEFRASLALSDAPELLFNLAQCARNLGDHPRALELYRAFLGRRPDAPNRAKVEEYIAEEQRLASPPPVRREVVAQPIEPPPAPAREPPRRRRALWIGLGVGAAVLAAAAVAVALALAPAGTDLGVHTFAPLVRF